MDSFINYPNLDPLLTSDPEYDAITKQIILEYPRACICMIDRVRMPAHTVECLSYALLSRGRRSRPLSYKCENLNPQWQPWEC